MKQWFGRAGVQLTVLLFIWSLAACGMQEDPWTKIQTPVKKEAPASAPVDYSDYEIHEIKNGRWLLSKDHRKLVIQGQGEIWAEEAWHDYDEEIEEVLIEEGVTMISAGAAYPKIGFIPVRAKKVTLPKSLEKIGAAAFSGCADLTEIEIPENVQYIQERAFKNCASLRKIILPKELQFIGDSAFSSCRCLTTVTVPGTVKTLGDSAFSDCYGLKTVFIESGVEKIGTLCFRHCSTLKEIHLSKTCKRLEGCADSEEICWYLEGKAEDWEDIGPMLPAENVKYTEK